MSIFVINEISIAKNISENDYYSQWTRIKINILSIKAAQDYFNHGIYDKSIFSLKKFLNTQHIPNRTKALAYIGLASSYVEKGIKDKSYKKKEQYYKKAYLYFNNAQKLIGNNDLLNISICSGLGLINLEFEKYPEAISYLKESLNYPLSKFKKEHIDVYIYLGFTFEEQDKYKKAADYFNQALKLHPSDRQTIYIYRGLAECYEKFQDYKKAFFYLNQALKLSSSDDQMIYVYTDLAECYEDLQDYKKSISYLNKALKLSPSDDQTVDIYTDLAECYKKTKSYPKAISCLRKAVLITSSDSKEYKDISEDFISTLLKYKLKQSSLSLRQIFSLLNKVKKYSKRNENVLLDRYVWRLLDRCYKDLSHKSDKTILKILGKYNLLKDNTIFTHLFRGNFYFYKKDFARAKKEFLAILKINPDSPIGYAGLKNIYIKEEKPLEALRCFIKAKRIIGKKYFLPVYKNLSEIYNQIKKKTSIKDLQALFETVKQIVPQYQDVLYCALGEIYFEHNMLDKAKEYFELAIKSQISPDVVHRDWPYEGLGKVYLKEKKYKIAKKYFIKALKINPSSAQAMSNLGNFYFNQNQFDEAKKFYQQTIKQVLEDDNEEEIKGIVPYVYLNLGDIARKEGEYKKAQRYYHKVLEYSNLDTQKEVKKKLKTLKYLLTNNNLNL